MTFIHIYENIHVKINYECLDIIKEGKFAAFDHKLKQYKLSK